MMAFEHYNTSPTQRQAALQVQKLSPNQPTNRQRGGAGVFMIPKDGTVWGNP
jgi:hypothetical protein